MAASRCRYTALLTGLGCLALLPACAGRRPQAQAPAAEPGRAQFQNYCAACHVDVPGEAPPLAGSAWVAGPEDRLIRIVLHGVRGPIEVAGKTYDKEMPGFGQILPDTDVAALLTYVRKRFGPEARPVTPEAVGRVRSAHASRTEYWSAPELLGNR